MKLYCAWKSIHTRRLYNYFNSEMRAYHHVNVNKHMRADLQVWKKNLMDPVVYCRPFIDYTEILIAESLDWHTDASGKIGFGGIHQENWFRGDWPQQFLQDVNPSIEYLELFAVVISVKLWAHNYRNKPICLFCDNQAVVHMINNSTSGCPKSMSLIRKLTLTSLHYNIHIFV